MRDLFKDSTFYLLLSFIQKGVAFFLLPFYALYLSPNEFGFANQVIGLHTFYILLLTFSLNETLAVFLVKEKDPDREVLIIVLINVLFSILFLIGYYFLDSWLYNYFINSISAEFKSLSVLIVIFTPPFLIYQKYLRIKRFKWEYGIIMLLFTVIQLSTSYYLLAIEDMGAHGFLGSLALTTSMFGLYSYWRMIRSVKFRSINIAMLWNRLRYSGVLVPHTFSGWGLNGFTNLFLGRIVSASAVGVLNASNIVGIVINVFSKAILDALQPWIYNKLKNDSLNEVRVLLILTYLVLCFLGVILISVSPLMFEILLPMSYSSGQKLAPLLVLNSVFLAFGSLSVYVIYFYRSHIKWVSLSTFLGASVNIALGYYLMTTWGVLGAVVSLNIANFLIMIIKVHVAQKILGLKLPIIKIVIFFMSFVCLFYLLNDYLLLVSIVYLIIFVFWTMMIYHKYRYA